MSDTRTQWGDSELHRPANIRAGSNARCSQRDLFQVWTATHKVRLRQLNAGFRVWVIVVAYGEPYFSGETPESVPMQIIMTQRTFVLWPCAYELLVARATSIWPADVRSPCDARIYVTIKVPVRHRPGSLARQICVVATLDAGPNNPASTRTAP